MEGKKAQEAFRVTQFSGPHPGLAALANGISAGPRSDEVQQDRDRVILHFDVDAFYAQVEEVRNPSLRHVPLGVTQKYLIVTCNYLARAAGVTKLMGIPEAQQRCPALVLVSGEDLTPYRQASKDIMKVLQRFGPAEKLGLDEVFVDVTEEVFTRLVQQPQLKWHGHLIDGGALELTYDNQYRPQDLRVAKRKREVTEPLSKNHLEEEDLDIEESERDEYPCVESSEHCRRLMVGSSVAEEARRAVKQEVVCRHCL